MKTSLKMLITSLLAFALLGILAQPAEADVERIISFHSEIDLFPDGTMEVTEHITVRSLQRNIRRGIYRDFPTRYRDGYGNRVRVDFEVIDVLRDGLPEPWFTENQINGIRVNTGDDSFLPGPGNYTFSIRYRTNRQLGFFAEHDELYWNVTGLGWAFQIEQASAELRLPEPVPAASLRLDSYTGPSGSQTSHARAEVIAPGQVRFETSRTLNPREGLTISVGFPKGIIEQPSLASRTGWLAWDNRGLLLLLPASVLILLFYLREWQAKGRGPVKGVIIARYEPPAGYSPAGLRWVVRRNYDQRCFSADLVELAVKGKLKIERDKRLFRDRWKLVRLVQHLDISDPPSQKALFPALFGTDHELELKKSNATRLQSAMSKHTAALRKRYRDHYINFNVKTLTIGWLASVLAVILSFLISGGSGVPVLVGLTVVLGIINIIFTGLMPAPTERGRKLLDHIEGLKLYLSVAERDELRALEQVDGDDPRITPERYEALLPYALALDVEQAWTSRLTRAVGAAAADQARSRMSWYTGTGAAVGSMAGLSRALGSNLTSTISSSSTPPGSSSGGGGGGSSGGGGGGGGGGGR